MFPEDVSDFPPEREVEFRIDLILTTSHVSMAPYPMLASYLKELRVNLRIYLRRGLFIRVCHREVH